MAVILYDASYDAIRASGRLDLDAPENCEQETRVWHRTLWRSFAVASPLQALHAGSCDAQSRRRRVRDGLSAFLAKVMRWQVDMGLT